MPLEILVFYGSVRTNRQGIKAARYIVNRCRERGHEVDLIDPREDPLPLLDRMYKEYEKGKAPEVLERIAGKIRRPMPSSSSRANTTTVSPALSNLLDHFLEEYFWRPSAIVCYSGGPFGGVRAAMQLRAMLCELGMPSIPSLFPVPKVQDAFEDDGTPRDPAFDRRVGRFLDELEWYARALHKARQGGVPY